MKGDRFRYDCNGVQSTEQAIRFGQAIEDLNNDYLEDPVYGMHGMRRVREKVRMPLATNTVVINFSRPVYTLLYFIANTPQLPENLWSKVNPATYPDTNPAGTGPYVVSSFTSAGITLTRNPHYWGGTPPVARVEFPAYDSNESANLAL